jgi:endonuclease YncB( thermonuclease family)
MLEPSPGRTDGLPPSCRIGLAIFVRSAEDPPSPVYGLGVTTRTNALTAVVAFLAMLTGTLALTTTTAPAAVPDQAVQRSLDRDCGDFGTQAAAQNYFLSIGGPDRDPDALDADGDGVACESNPCPCSTSQGGGGGGGGTGGGDSGPKLPPRKVSRGNVIRVIDGDTVQVRTGGRKVTVRMIGIDTPEVFGGKECGGPEASAYLKRVLPRGTRVKLVSDRTQDLKDRFGRQLRYVFKNGRKDMNKNQVAVGAAKVYVFGGKRFEKYRSYAKAQEQAKRQKRGIWGAC